MMNKIYLWIMKITIIYLRMTNHNIFMDVDEQNIFMDDEDNHNIFTDDEP